MESLFEEFSQLVDDYVEFWRTQKESFVRSVEILIATSTSHVLSKKMLDRDDPMEDTPLTILQSLEYNFASKITPLINQLNIMVQRMVKVVKLIDRYIHQRQLTDPSSFFEMNLPSLYPSLERLNRSIIVQTALVMDAIDDINYTDVECFEPLHKAILSVHQSIEELKDMMVRINVMMKEEIEI